VEIRSAIAAADLEDRVRLLGQRSDVPALMQAADAFVMSSAWEGLPIVLLEASASSLPIVATDVGGSHDAIVDGASGHVVPPGDAAALGDAMRAVMALPVADRLAMGEASRRHVSESFDMERVADTWEELYRSLLAAKGR
jgi:glycosyltransferase involved in cell wall biosynthesis